MNQILSLIKITSSDCSTNSNISQNKRLKYLSFNTKMIGNTF